MNKIIVIVGPTGVGKTKLSIALAKKYNAVIINGDSVQIYKHLNIGSAKIKKKEMENICHYMIDFISPNTNYTVFDYQKEARKILNNFIEQNKNVIIVGGTGLYIKALLYNYEFNNEIKNIDYSNYSNQELYNLVLKKDSNSDIHINNRRRMISFLNRGFLSHDSNTKLYDFITIGLTTNRDNLYNIINNRVDEMIKLGLIDEVKDLYIKYPNSRILNSAIGYKEVIRYLKNEINLDEMINEIKQNSRRYAKRQYTFFNNQMDVKWFDVDYKNFNNTINNILDYIKK